jgi:hypothetical protein
VLLLSALIFSTEVLADPAPNLGLSNASAHDGQVLLASSAIESRDLPVMNQSVMTTEDASNPFSLDHYYVDYFGTYHGSDLSQVGKPYMADQNGKATHSAMYFDSELTTAYLVTPDIGVGLDFAFSYTPVLGQDLTMNYIGLKVLDRKTIYKNGFTLYTNLILQKPVVDYELNRGVVAGIKSTPFVRYQIPNSRFTIGSWNEIKDYAGATQGKMYKLYVSPYINYQATSLISINLGYEIEADHFASTSGMSIYESDFQPGFIVNVTKYIRVNPYLQFFTTNKVSMDTTAIGAVITARLL